MSALPDLSSDRSVGALYEQHYPFLIALARKKYDLDEEEAQPLVHDVFLNLIASRRPVEHAQAYLVVGLCRACGEHWRKKKRESTQPEEFFQNVASRVDEDAMVRRLTVQASMRTLRERCRQTLNLYFVQGCTSKEVASRLDTTSKYAEKLISSCLKKLRCQYRDLSEM